MALDFHTADNAEPPHVSVHEAESERVVAVFYIVGNDVDSAGRAALAHIAYAKGTMTCR